MRGSLPAAQSLSAGYADTSGFLALKGLFTAHVTGNFVTLGSSLVFGTTGVLTKTLAMPMFCLVVLLARLLAFRLKAAGWPVVRSLLRLQLLLLVASAALAVWLGPFENPDGWPALAVGLTLVAAMATQNATHRAHLGHTPPSTVMTGSSTQIMLDVADLLHGLRPEAAVATRARLRRTILTVVAFTAGCGLAALFYAQLSQWCFCALPILGFATLMMRADITEADGRN
jgi:uncharacterized membrane protein YoaK (UPF0700 family)